jgi:hypothetical protein
MRGREVSMKRIAFLLLSLSVSLSAFANPNVTSIQPSIGPTSGGTAVLITGTDLLPSIVCVIPCPVTVTFGDVTVEATEESATRIRVVTPPHAAGTVDVRVNIPGEEPVRLPNAFTYSEGQSYLAYEQVLLPVYLSNAAGGAGGSLWITNFWMRNNGPEPVLFAPFPCPDGQTCPAVVPLTTELVPGRTYKGLPPHYGEPAANPSRLFYVSRGLADQLSFGLRFGDVSRDVLHAGTEMPVVRERDVLTTRAQLFDIPTSHNYRVLVRVYDLQLTNASFRLSFYPQEAGDQAAPLYTVDLQASAPQIGAFRTEAAYSQYNPVGLLSSGAVLPEKVRIEVTPLTPGSRFWVFASITNELTNLVTLSTPQ